MFSILLLSVSSSCQLNAVLHEISGLPEAVTVVGVTNHHQRLVEKKDKSQDHLVNEFAEGTHYYWRFPAELLFKIFHHCLPDTGPNTKGFTPLLRLTTSRLLITICRRWREVATSIPSLWCRLHGLWRVAQASTGTRVLVGSQVLPGPIIRIHHGASFILVWIKFRLYRFLLRCRQTRTFEGCYVYLVCSCLILWYEQERKYDVTTDGRCQPRKH